CCFTSHSKYYFLFFTFNKELITPSDGAPPAPAIKIFFISNILNKCYSLLYNHSHRITQRQGIIKLLNEKILFLFKLISVYLKLYWAYQELFFLYNGQGLSC